MKQQTTNYKQTEIVEIRKKVHSVVEKLYKRDFQLFQMGVHERTIAHKFAEYLQQEYKGVFNVDCEYNREGFSVKALKQIVKDKEEKKEYRIFPDIIVHIRGKKDSVFNKLVIEIKSSNGNDAGDIEKLCGLTSRKHGFNYKYGLFIRFKNNIEVGTPIEKLVLKQIWFQNGREIKGI